LSYRRLPFGYILTFTVWQVKVAARNMGLTTARIR